VTELVEGIISIPKFHEVAASFWNSEEWNKTYVGWQYANLPSREFLELLKQVAQDGMYGSTIVGTRSAALAQELDPFYVLRDTLETLRRDQEHKGIPRVHGDILTLSSPAASGLASLNASAASDEVWCCVPGQTVVGIVAMQSGTVDAVHIGGGELQGMHFMMRFPKTPFLPEMRERIRANDKLRILWEECAPCPEREGDSMRWMEATMSLRAAVVADHAQ